MWLALFAAQLVHSQHLPSQDMADSRLRYMPICCQSCLAMTSAVRRLAVLLCKQEAALLSRVLVMQQISLPAHWLLNLPAQPISLPTSPDALP